MFETSFMRLYAPESRNLVGQSRQATNVPASPIWQGEAYLRHMRQEQALHRLGQPSRNIWECRVCLPYELMEDPGPPEPGWKIEANVEWKDRVFTIISATTGLMTDDGVQWHFRLEDRGG